MKSFFRNGSAGLLLWATTAGHVWASERGCAAAPSEDAGYRGVIFTSSSYYLSAERLRRISERVAGCAIGATPPAFAERLVNAAYDAVPAPLALARATGVRDRRIVVDLVEVRYGAVSVSGNPTTRSGYVIGRAGVREGAVADLARLEGRLSGFPEIEGIRVDADLSPGTEEGTSDLALSVTEPEPFSFVAALDNTGDSALGALGVSASLTWRSVTGHRDPLSLSLEKSEGAEAGSVSYTFPLGTRGLRQTLSYDISRSERISGDPALLGLRSKTRNLATTLAYPVRADETGRSILTGSFEYTLDESDLGGVALQDQTTREASVGYLWLTREAARYEASVSARVAYGKTRDRIAGDRFDHLRAKIDAALTYRITDALSGLSTLGLQVADGSLPSAKRMSAAGPTAVRGYPEGGDGDAAVVLRNEVIWSRAITGDWSQASPFAFFDIGDFYIDGGRGMSSQGGVASIGLGLRAVLQPRQGSESVIEFNGHVGYPLRQTATFPDTGARVVGQLSVAF